MFTAGLQLSANFAYQYFASGPCWFSTVLSKYNVFKLLIKLEPLPPSQRYANLEREMVSFYVLKTYVQGSAYPTMRCEEQVMSCFSEAGSDEIEIGVCQDYQHRCYETSVWTGMFYFEL